MTVNVGGGGAAGASPDGPYRPCVGIALFNPAGLVFIGKRKGVSGDHAWQMPQGGIDGGETPLDAARRELAEEAGVTSAQLLAEAPDWLSYDLPPELIKASWAGRYRGQAQRWFAFRFTGEDEEINVHAPPGGHRPEFDDWRWAPLATVPRLIVPFKAAVYVQVTRLFADFAKSI